MRSRCRQGERGGVSRPSPWLGARRWSAPCWPSEELASTRDSSPCDDRGSGRYGSPSSGTGRDLVTSRAASWSGAARSVGPELRSVARNVAQLSLEWRGSASRGPFRCASPRFRGPLAPWDSQGSGTHLAVAATPGGNGRGASTEVNHEFEYSPFTFRSHGCSSRPGGVQCGERGIDRSRNGGAPHARLRRSNGSRP